MQNKVQIEGTLK